MANIGIIGAIKSFVQKRPYLTLFLLLSFFIGFLFINIEVLHFTSSPQFCAKCHPKEGTGPLTEVYTWKKNIHSQHGVSCLDCHGRPGFFYYMKAKIKGLSDLYNFAAKGKEHMIEVLQKSINDPVYASQVVSMESCLYCHTDYYNQKFRKERIMTLAGITFRALDNIKNPQYRISKNMIDIMREDVRSNPDIDPKHAAHIRANISCIFCHRGVAHSGELISYVSKDANNLENVCTTCHLNNKDVISMRDIVLSKAGNPAKFSHNFHLQMFECSTCHPSLFKMKAGTSAISFETHSKDIYCFTCHGQNKSASFDCALCHQGG